MRIERWIASALLAATLALGGDAEACGPHFPNNVLTGAGADLLSLPAMEFGREIERIPRPELPEASFIAVTHEDGGVADAAEIATALRARGDSPDVVAATVEAVVQFRRKLPNVSDRDEPSARRRANADVARVPAPPAGLPRVFDLHLRGLAAWRTGDRGAATKAWRTLLDLPAAERSPRLVWAQYMLGRIDVDSAPASAVKWFAAARDCVRRGAPDPVGLAAASAGWEARAELNRGRLVRALTLYHALGDETSVLVVLRRVFADPSKVAEIAGDPLTRRLGTAYVVSQGGAVRDGGAPPDAARVAQWLAAIEAVAAQTIADADRLAWIAYDAGDIDVARRWLARVATRSPVAAWVEAKILLHDGHVADASARLVEASRGFPTNESWTVAYGTVVNEFGEVAPSRRLLAEHGAIELSRGDFASSLEALLAAGDWLDAVYVAERVLTTDELSQYVSAHCPLAEGSADADAFDSGAVIPSAAVHCVLARRLARDGRWNDALPHFPAELRRKAESFTTRLAAGRDVSNDRVTRANALRDAARILRADGMELTGTEGAPDWSAFGGSYELKDFAAERPPGSVNCASASELDRAKANAAQPAKRFHYRFLASDIAWDAATLMPDENDATASWLREAGMWIAPRDPKAAERFYKALVRRCGTTTLGRAAVTAKWFPK